MQCVKLYDACGPSTVRVLGTTQCMCGAGYYRLLSKCVQCPANYYCTGNSDSPQACAINGISQPGSSQASQCSCRPGYYYYQEDICLACPVGFWCLGGRMLPIPCTTHASTAASGSTSPLDCVCLPRTHGFLCSPCTDSELCSLMPTQPQWQALRVMGWGTSPSGLSQCFPQPAIFYSIPGPQPATGRAQPWGFLIVLPTGLGPAQATECVGGVFLLSEPISVFSGPKLARGIMYNQSCPMNSEWSRGQDCACIGGYSSVRVGTFDICIPCPNGTIRPRYTENKCVPCPENSSAFAPWAGMSHCVCTEGTYYYDPDASKCRPIPDVGGGSWVYSWLSLPAVAISLTVSLGIICILASVALGLLK
jgi:hypothetical protein